MQKRKDETEIGIAGLPIPKKKLSAKNRHEFEKKRRANLGRNVGGRTYKSDVSPYVNPHSVREEFDSWVDELWNEGYDLSNWTWEGLFEHYCEEEAEYILNNLTEEEIHDLLEKKDIPQEIALKVADTLKNAPRFSRRGQFAAKAREFAATRGRKASFTRADSKQGITTAPTQKEECEVVEAHSFPLKPSELRSLEKIKRMNRGDFSDSSSERTKSAKKVETKPAPVEQPAKRKPSISRSSLSSIVKEDFDIVSEFLFVEGYTDTVESAEIMAENISQEWVNEILEARYWYQDKSPESQEKFRKMDQAYNAGERNRPKSNPKTRPLNFNLLTNAIIQNITTPIRSKALVLFRITICYLKLIALDSQKPKSVLYY
jgi:hypothetical protein